MTDTRWLAVNLAAALFPLSVLGQVPFPGNPTSSMQCDAARRHGEQLAAAAHQRGVNDSNQAAGISRQRQSACRPGMGDYWGCVEPYDRAVSKLRQQTLAHYRERDRITAEVRQKNASCMTMARAQEKQQGDLRRQQEQAAARSDAMRRQQQADLERANRQAAQPQRNEPRVIAQTQPSPYNPATRNEPRQVQTPDMAVQARAEQQRQAEVQRQREAQALRNVANQVAAALTGDARRAGDARERITDQAFNPEGHQDSRVSASVEQVQAANRAMNRGGPAVVQIQNDSLYAAGAANNNALGQLDSALASTNSGSQPQQPRSAPAPGAAAIALPRRESSGAAVFQQAIADQARPASPQGPSRPAYAGDCQQSYDAQEADFKALMSRRPGNVSSVPDLQNLMFMTSERVRLLDDRCRGHARYDERRDMQATYDNAHRTCMGVASSASYCVPRRGW